MASSSPAVVKSARATAFDGFCLSLYAPGSAMPSTDTSREPLSVAGNDNGRGKEKARR
jgi:hypothetical protein